jgi:hypothetical protein
LTWLFLYDNQLNQAAQTLIANYRTQKPECFIRIDPLSSSSSIHRVRYIGALAFGALAVFSAYVYSNLAP